MADDAGAQSVGDLGVKAKDGADELDWQIRAAGLPPFVREYRFHPSRMWRLDLARPEAKLAVEIDGGVFSGGRHTRGVGYEADCVKAAELAILGWRLIRVTTRHVKNGAALQWIERALKRSLEAA